MNLNYLDFEQPIAELEDKIDALESIKDDVDIAKEMDSLKTKSEQLTKKYSLLYQTGKFLNLLDIHKDFTHSIILIKFLMSLPSCVEIVHMRMITL